MPRTHQAPADKSSPVNGVNGLPTVPAKPIKIAFAKLLESANIATLLDKDQLMELGRTAVSNYDKDKGTRTVWEERNVEAIKLALQVVEVKNFPWPDCSNVKFPLLTIAALQFLARISVMTKGRNLVKVQTIGADLTGEKGKQAVRISTHLSMQIAEEAPNWTDSDEECKLAASIMGSAFKKTYHDSVQGVVISEHVPAANLVMDYYTKDVDHANRITQVLSMNANAIKERERRGLFCEMTKETPAQVPTNQMEEESDDQQGLQRPINDSGSDFFILEQHCWMDLDGDGYEEPYIMFVRQDTQQVLRIVAKFYDEGDVHRVNDPAIRKLENELAVLAEAKIPENEPEDSMKARMKARSELEKKVKALEEAPGNHIVRIDGINYFTRYLFIPSPDGGVYGLGLGSLLGPMNETVSTLINQMVDSGTMATTAGGFLGRGVKMKGGKQTFDPFEWKPVDSTGDDLRKNIMPLPVREASNVLFQLLGMLVGYAERISGATDIMTGVSPGQNTPAETSRNTVEQGMMLFSGIYGRMYRGFREEIKKFATLNRLYLTSSPRFAELTVGPNAIIAKDDYIANTFRIFPAASPEAVSQQQLKDKADKLVQAAVNVPGFAKREVMLRWLNAYDYEDIEAIYPDPAGPNAVPPPGPDPKAANDAAKIQLQAKIHEDEMQLAVAELQQEAGLTEAKITQLRAQATMALASADGVTTGQQISMINAQIGAAKARQDGIHKSIELLQNHMKIKTDAKAKGVKPHDPSDDSTDPTVPSAPTIPTDNGPGEAGVVPSSGDAGIPVEVGGGEGGLDGGVVA